MVGHNSDGDVGARRSPEITVRDLRQDAKSGNRCAESPGAARLGSSGPGGVVNVQPRITSRNSEAESDSTVLLPTRSANGPHTFRKTTLANWLRTVRPMTAGRESPSLVSLKTAKKGIAKLEVMLPQEKEPHQLGEIAVPQRLCENRQRPLAGLDGRSHQGSLALETAQRPTGPSTKVPPNSRKE